MRQSLTRALLLLAVLAPARTDFVLDLLSTSPTCARSSAASAYYSLMGCTADSGTSFALACANASYGVLNFFSTPNCSGEPYDVQAPDQFLPGSGAFAPCGAASSGAYSATTCEGGAPGVPPLPSSPLRSLTLAQWSGATCSARGALEGFLVAAVGVCSPGSGLTAAAPTEGPPAASSYTVACAGASYSVTSYNSSSCSGPPVATTLYGACEDRDDTSPLLLYTTALVACAGPAAPPGEAGLPAAASAATAAACVMLALAGGLAGSGPWFWPALVLPAALLGRQVWLLDIHDPALCLRLFKSNREAGLAVALAFLAGRL